MINRYFSGLNTLFAPTGKKVISTDTGQDQPLAGRYGRRAGAYYERLFQSVRVSI